MRIRLGLLSIKEAKEQISERQINPPNIPTVNQNIEAIQQLADAYHADFFLLVIPELFWGQFYEVDYFPNLFVDQLFYRVPVQKKDYEPKYVHYNDQGHKKHAEFILKLIEASAIKNKIH